LNSDRLAACAFLLVAVLAITACGATRVDTGAMAAPAATAASAAATGPRVLAVETFLADIAQNVAGDRLKVDALMPLGVDPHAFQPTPADVRKVAESDLLIVNGAGVEEFLKKLLENAGGDRPVAEASAGLSSRQPTPDEPAGEHSETDPHFWLDPVLVQKYVENIRDALSKTDPAGKEIVAIC
jgi:ABC-type Zn uptake system ZnuABC Zn-binding protein ZnuA